MRKRIRSILRVLLVACVLYGLDYLSALAGVPSRPRYETVTINRFFFINEKYDKFSYEPIPSVQETCVNALLPEIGARPCWYVRRHRVETIAVN
jgi:hypothetical protein